VADQPSWVLALVAAVELYEECHPRVDGPGWDCLDPALNRVPDDVRTMAKGYAERAAAEETQPKTEAAP
jgi:hypothetical protein